MGVAPGYLIDMRGAFDLHFHSAPCVFPRLATDRQVTEAACQMEFGGLLFKCHHESTVSRAAALQDAFPGMHLFGGIVLNRHVGGINPRAVEAALELGAKAVWLPTVDAAHHAVVHGKTGGYGVQSTSSQLDSSMGISAVREGRITPETRAVFELIAKHNAYLGTSHTSYAELRVIIPAAFEQGIKKVSLTHPFYKTPGLTLEQIQEFVGMGAIAEFGYCSVSPMWATATLGQVAEAIKTLGPENCVLMSDAGQRHNPIPPEALRIYAQSLFELGIGEEEIRTMICHNPARLVGLQPSPTPMKDKGAGAK
jgi:hypothetical protein